MRGNEENYRRTAVLSRGEVRGWIIVLSIVLLSVCLPRAPTLA